MQRQPGLKYSAHSGILFLFHFRSMSVLKVNFTSAASKGSLPLNKTPESKKRVGDEDISADFRPIIDYIHCYI